MAKYRNIKKEFTPYILGKNSEEEVIAITELLEKHGKREHPNYFYLRVVADVKSRKTWYELWNADDAFNRLLTEGDFIYEDPYTGEFFYHSKLTFDRYYTEVPTKKGVYIPKEKIITAFEINYNNNDDLFEILSLIESNNTTTSFINTMEIKRQKNVSNDIVCVVKQGDDIDAISGDFVIVNNNNKIEFMTKDKFLNEYELVSK
jgi:hypothetical protein